jgi:hypothetical protein
MAIIRSTLPENASGPIAVELIDQNLEIVESQTIGLDTPQFEQEVVPGNYALRFHLSSGVTVTKQAKVQEATDVVEIPFSTSDLFKQATFYKILMDTTQELTRVMVDFEKRNSKLTASAVQNSLEDKFGDMLADRESERMRESGLELNEGSLINEDPVSDAVNIAQSLIKERDQIRATLEELAPDVSESLVDDFNEEIRSSRFGQLGVWFQAWTFNAAENQYEPISAKDLKEKLTIQKNLALDEYRFEFSSPQPTTFLQIGGTKIRPRLVATPYRQAKIILTYNTRNEAGSPSFDIRVESNTPGQTLLNHMHRGDIHLAQMISDPTLAQAENLLYNKLSDPIEATIGAYYLLKTRSFDRMHSWAKNLANWFEHIADGAIIFSWQLLEENPTPEAIEKARNYLLSAVKKPLPLFTQGLRLLYDGLSLLDEEKQGDDNEVSQALQEIKPYVQACDWNTFTTTFFGEHPRKPTRITDKNLLAERRNSVVKFITYTVKTGDTLPVIAARFGTTADAISTENQIAPPYEVFVGQTLKLLV